MRVLNLQNIMDDLLEWAQEENKPLPAPPISIAAAEITGHIIDLETGEKIDERDAWEWILGGSGQ